MSHPNPQICDYVTLHGKKKFTDMINLKILRWRNYPGGPNLITKFLKRGSQKVKVRGKDVQMEVEVKVLQP